MTDLRRAFIFVTCAVVHELKILRLIEVPGSKEGQGSQHRPVDSGHNVIEVCIQVLELIGTSSASSSSPC